MKITSSKPSEHLSRDPKILSSPVWTKPPDNQPVGHLLQLTEHTCRWPWDTSPISFCGVPAEEDKPYCKAHCAVAYHPAPPLRLKKPRNT